MAKINQKFLLGQSKNPVSGTLFKSHPDSFIYSFAIGSPVYFDVFDPKPKVREMEVIVLQVMNIGKDYVLVEVIKK
jgi:hypothetical protein